MGYQVKIGRRFKQNFAGDVREGEDVLGRPITQIRLSYEQARDLLVRLWLALPATERPVPRV